MALTGTTTSTSYTGNGTTTAFPTEFSFFATGDLVVTSTPSGGATSTLVEGADYTVSGGSGSSGTVTCTTAPASGTTLKISRSTALTQPTSLRTQGNYSPSVHEDALDRATMLIQELAARVTALGG